MSWSHCNLAGASLYIAIHRNTHYKLFKSLCPDIAISLASISNRRLFIFILFFRFLLLATLWIFSLSFRFFRLFGYFLWLFWLFLLFFWLLLFFGLVFLFTLFFSLLFFLFLFFMFFFIRNEFLVVYRALLYDSIFSLF